VTLETLPVIKGDATQLRQVIHNLLQNAQDAVADLAQQEVSIETRAVEYGDADPSGKRRVAVRLAISDNGAGFPARILTRAFEPYVTTKAKGTGLGLAMVKKIVDEHGGRIDLRNRSRHGQEGVSGAQVSILFLQLAEDDDTTGADHASAVNNVADKTMNAPVAESLKEPISQASAGMTNQLAGDLASVSIDDVSKDVTKEAPRGKKSTDEDASQPKAIAQTKVG